ncbi:hypothetical protein CWS_01140 [Buchnera aphidicola str. JF99 (Acyrthosiphon pisum)]|nr:hypothetical protein CWQ_01165 [Buchnera aphidicola str. TLW03 (Acyrthosiphon pisum)]ADP67191.1 hypothetical protein CWS_01140 [Buchnera aphidicola str. JF99 (Acyrthosiphon pisum)]ADP67736.1 hypothetical protein CWU_01390 [Buchnera aphidicola str. JF98 (Acyrthosiphon pisum)]
MNIKDIKKINFFISEKKIKIFILSASAVQV